MKQKEVRWKPEDLLPVRIPVEVRRAITRHPVRWQKQILLRKTLAGEDIPHAALEPIDYEFRPSCYFQPEDLRQLVANIKGAERKRKALRLIEAGHLDEASDFILADTLSEEERIGAGQIHPTFMGGEFLPDYDTAEVEIARITMASTTQDVISIRACPRRGGISYRVVDEYESPASITPEKSKRPLNLHQLIRLIDSASREEMGPIGLGIIEDSLDCSDSSAEYFADFLEFSSEFYPGLSVHYWFAIQRLMGRNSRIPAKQRQASGRLP